MTAIRSNHVSHRTVLDFSGERCSKNQIKKALRTLEVQAIEHSQSDGSTHLIYNSIKVGMYVITLVLGLEEGTRKLREFGGMMVSIRETNGKLPIDLDRDGRFKTQYWCNLNTSCGFRVNHLVEAIAHCQRLDGLKAFL